MIMENKVKIKYSVNSNINLSNINALTILCFMFKKLIYIFQHVNMFYTI